MVGVVRVALENISSLPIAIGVALKMHLIDPDIHSRDVGGGVVACQLSAQVIAVFVAEHEVKGFARL